MFMGTHLLPFADVEDTRNEALEQHRMVLTFVKRQIVSYPRIKQQVIERFFR